MITDVKEGQIVVDIGSGAGIDVFLAANKVKDSGKVFGIDMTDEMLEKARNNAKQSGFTNVEFKKASSRGSSPNPLGTLLTFFAHINLARRKLLRT